MIQIALPFLPKAVLLFFCQEGSSICTFHDCRLLKSVTIRGYHFFVFISEVLHWLQKTHIFIKQKIRGAYNLIHKKVGKRGKTSLNPCFTSFPCAVSNELFWVAFLVWNKDAKVAKWSRWDFCKVKLTSWAKYEISIGLWFTV